MPLYLPSDLTILTTEIFQAHGVPDKVARVVADSLVQGLSHIHI